MIHTFTVVEPKKPGKKIWDTYYHYYRDKHVDYYRDTHIDSQKATVWISELAITDQRTIFDQMGDYTRENQDRLLQARTDKYWGREFKRVQKHFNKIQEPFFYGQKSYDIPLLLSFPDGFTEYQIADIMQWYRQMVTSNRECEFPWNLPDFEENFTIKLPELAEFQEALKKASRDHADIQHHVNHFVFKGHNIFLESQMLLILYDSEIHMRPTVYKEVHPKSRRKLNMDDPIIYEITTIVEKDGKNRYQRQLSNGALVECTRTTGDIISYLPPTVSPKKGKTKQKEPNEPTMSPQEGETKQKE